MVGIKRWLVRFVRFSRRYFGIYDLCYDMEGKSTNFFMVKELSSLFPTEDVEYDKQYGDLS